MVDLFVGMSRGDDLQLLKQLVTYRLAHNWECAHNFDITFLERC